MGFLTVLQQHGMMLPGASTIPLRKVNERLGCMQLLRQTTVLAVSRCWKSIRARKAWDMGQIGVTCPQMATQ